MAILNFKHCAIIIIKAPAEINRIDAKKNGGNSVTAILLNK
jgi:hypothetical protein